jgi:hypothetical protein
VFFNGSEDGFWYISSADGTTWSTPLQVLTTRLSASPSLAYYNNQIYGLMQGPNNDGELWSTIITPGNAANLMTKYPSVSAPLAANPMISWSPGAVAFGNQLYCFYEQYGNTGRLYYVVYGTNGWGSQFELDAYAWGSPGITGSPAAVEFNGELYVFYQGADWSGKLYYRTSSNGTDWVSQGAVPCGMSGWPSPVEFNNALYVFYEGEGNATSLWYSVYSEDNGTWSWGGLSKSIQMASLTSPPQAITSPERPRQRQSSSTGISTSSMWPPRPLRTMRVASSPAASPAMASRWVRRAWFSQYSRPVPLL